MTDCWSCRCGRLHKLQDGWNWIRDRRLKTRWLSMVQGGGAATHKVFGRKKLEKRREAVHSFIVRPLRQVRYPLLDSHIVVTLSSL